ncbi:short-chain fatty acyl-CoA regulator family protein [Ramlibacter tataouinensis]|uniref:helix-turn-helix domain-containing protein n=1 Tax=Ramlibacter tataouinensis TaxID=94132 RepID=UPI0022F3CC20|nr:short-chain fatty acyl-CoA regulator family protein [Ramlibacter tataouinensis]WBY03871.1 short-chain fatty acyl-CoA regulator family protein [Ramlibacter tataouinensis]
MARTLIGQRIRDQRRAQGVTQAALAQRVGISPSYLNLIESDRRNIAGALLHRIAQALGRPLEEFDGAAERRLLDELAEVAADPLLSSLRLDAPSAAELVARQPHWGRAVVALHRAGIAQRQVVAALSDRLSQDPFVAEAVHALLTRLTSIRSASEILEGAPPLEAAQQRRFVSIVAQDSRRLSEVAQALAAFLGRDLAARPPSTPAAEVDDYLFDRGNHFPQLEVAAQALAADLGGAAPDTPALEHWLRERQAMPDVPTLASPASRRFALARAACELACAAAVDAELAQAQGVLATAAAQQRARRALFGYAAAALLMPYEDFHAAAVAGRYDVELLARRFGTSFEQVGHRLASLRRPAAEGIPFGFMRTDPSGHVSKRLPLPRLPLPRWGDACPLWAVHAAFRTPGSVVRQLAEFPGGDRYLMVARTVEKDGAGFGAPQRLLSVMLFCDALHADRTVYGDGLDLSPQAPATPVGQACRVCVRRGCDWRQEEPLFDAGIS